MHGSRVRGAKLRRDQPIDKPQWRTGDITGAPATGLKDAWPKMRRTTEEPPRLIGEAASAASGSGGLTSLEPNNGRRRGGLLQCRQIVRIYESLDSHEQLELEAALSRESHAFQVGATWTGHLPMLGAITADMTFGLVVNAGRGSSHRHTTSRGARWVRSPEADQTGFDAGAVHGLRHTPSPTGTPAWRSWQDAPDSNSGTREGGGPIPTPRRAMHRARFSTPARHAAMAFRWC